MYIKKSEKEDGNSDMDKNFGRRTPEPRSLKSRLMFFVVVCWFVPIAVFGGFIFLSYRHAYLTKTVKLIENGVVNSTVLVSSRLDEDIKEILKPSYDRKWENQWRMMKEGNITPSEMTTLINKYLRGSFYLDVYDLYAFYLEEEDKPSCYSSKAGFGYDDYMEEVHPEVAEVVRDGTNYVQLRAVGNRAYLIRNLYTVTDFKKYGTLVVGLNTEKLTRKLPVEQERNVRFYLNDSRNVLSLAGDEEDTATARVFEEMEGYCDSPDSDRFVARDGDDHNAYLYQLKKDQYTLSMVYAVDHRMIYSDLYELYKLVIVMLSIFAPILIYVFFFFQRQIEAPVGKLVDAFRIIREGKFGTLVEGGPMPNEEFEYLADSFNNMSLRVKHLFDSVYSEKLARRDAQIAALQAQINPHFLNNTLEMMNWQARINGDVTISKMIEALGTVLDHNINRKNEKVVYLSEELRCADAYLYIMSMRFGQRLRVEKEIDEGLLRMKVPQLILQPLLENAIMHGVERVKTGVIRLIIRRDGENVCLDVVNSGSRLSEEDFEKIRSLLSGETAVPKGGGEHTSIGIRNVNKRIKLVYGEQYGLDACSLETGETRFRITLPCPEDFLFLKEEEKGDIHID